MNDKPAGVFKDNLTISGFTLRLRARAEQVDWKEAGSRSRGPVPSQSPVAAATTAQAPWPAQAPSGAPSPTVFVDKRREQRRYRTGRNQ